MEPTIVERAALRAATVSHVGPYHMIGEAFARLQPIVASAGLSDPGAAFLAIYHDDPESTPASSLRSEAGLVVDPGVALPASLTETWVPPGRYLRAQHLGSYEGLPAAWARLRNEQLRGGALTRRAGPSYELYLNNPGTVSIPELVTEIYIPVAGR